MTIPGSRRARAAALTLVALATMIVAPAALAAPPGFSIWSIAGNGTPCTTAPSCGDTGPATSAQLNYAQGVAVDSAGNVYIADWGDNEIRKVSPSGAISVVAGDGVACSSAPACGDGGPATSAALNFPEAVVVDSAGNVYVADAGDNEIRKVSPAGVITRIAGNGTPCSAPPACGDHSVATGAQLNSPGGVAVDAAGNVYVADSADNEVRKISTGGMISRVAGDGTLCPTAPACGDGGAAVSAQLSFPDGVAAGRAGDLYIADTGDNEIRKVSRQGTITTVAGNGSLCSQAPACGDGGRASNAQLGYPESVVVSPAGTVYVTDWGDNEIRSVSKTGTITRIAGIGGACAAPPSCGDGGGAGSAQLGAPAGLALDSAGNLFVADTYDHEVRWLALPALRPAVLHTPARIALLAFRAAASRGQVSVRYALSGSAPIALSIRSPSGAQAVVARASGQPGFNTISWNRRLAGRSAPAGTYRLTMRASSGARSASSTLTVRL